MNYNDNSCLYTGPIIDLFLADRLACGFAAEVIRADFSNFFGKPVGADELEDFRLKNAGLIQERHEILVKRIETESLFGRALAITRRIEDLVDEEFDIKNAKQLASLLSVLRAYQEMLLAKSKDVRTKVSDAPRIDFTSLFDELQKEGIIEIKDVRRLQMIVSTPDDPQDNKKPHMGVSFEANQLSDKPKVKSHIRRRNPPQEDQATTESKVLFDQPSETATATA